MSHLFGILHLVYWKLFVTWFLVLGIYYDLPFEKAMANEFKHGLASMADEAGQGAARFAKGAGRHGEF